MVPAFTSRSGLSFRLDQLNFSGESALAAFARFFAENGDNKPIALQRWRHRDNPAGESHATVAIDESRNAAWASVYVTQPVEFDCSGERVLATQSLDTLTDKHHRGHGLFPALAQDVYRRSANAGAQFVYGFPNVNSAPGFFGKLGWTNLDPVPFLLKPMRLSYFTERLFSRVAGRSRADIAEDETAAAIRLNTARVLPQGITRVTAFDTRFDSLWKNWAGGTTIGVARHARYLDWRLLRRPGSEYGILAATHAGALEGYVAFGAFYKHGGRIGYILELLTSRGDETAGSLLLRTAIRILRDARIDAILAWCMPHSANYSFYRRAGFFPLPARLRSIELHFGALAFEERHRFALAQRKNWYVSYLDSDTV